MHLDMFRVVSLERSIVRLVKMDQYRYYLTWTQLACTLPLFACCQATGFLLRLKAEPKVIDITKQLK